MPNQDLTHALERLAKIEPGKFEYETGDWGIYILDGGGKRHGWSVECLDQDGIDALLAEVGMQVYVSPIFENDANAGGENTLMAFFHTNGKYHSGFDTEVPVHSPQAQLNAKIIGFIRAIEILSEGK